MHSYKRYEGRWRKGLFLFLCVVTSLVAVSMAWGQTIYYWKDAKGIYHFYRTPPQGFTIRGNPGKVSRQQLDRKTLHRLAERLGKRHSVDPHLIRAVIKVESDYDPKVVSRAGAQGLMQIMPETQKDLGLENPFDPVENMDAGVRYLRMMLDRFKDIRLALAAYNAGPAAVEKYDGIPPFAETRKYVTNVLTQYRNNVKAQ